jgi:hypothetical protein
MKQLLSIFFLLMIITSFTYVPSCPCYNSVRAYYYKKGKLIYSESNRKGFWLNGLHLEGKANGADSASFWPYYKTDNK